jgi:hypothetical protein
MAHLKIEIKRGDNWYTRGEGIMADADVPVAFDEMLAAYTIQYPHRVVLNGRVIAEKNPPKKGAARRVAH